MTFPGGSAWAMVRDISEGYLLVTERSFVRLQRGELDQLTFELDRRLREVRGEQPPLDATAELQLRHRRISRLVGAQRILHTSRTRRKV
ncbi:MAG: hypothetical protein ACRD0X_07185 [Thermoanaerobaculia bacterium]